MPWSCMPFSGKRRCDAQKCSHPSEDLHFFLKTVLKPQRSLHLEKSIWHNITNSHCSNESCGSLDLGGRSLIEGLNPAVSQLKCTWMRMWSLKLCQPHCASNVNITALLSVYECENVTHNVKCFEEPVDLKGSI